MGLLSLGPPPPLLNAVLYDPAGAVNKLTNGAASVMAAVDTANLRLGFNVPANGAVRVRLRTVLHGSAANVPWILLGALEGSTIRGRVYPLGASKNTAVATAQIALEADYVVPGLTPTQALTWDAAFGIEQIVASTGMKYGGPNDATVDNAFGGFAFEVWEAPNLLGAVLYDPAASVAKSAAARLAMTAIDTANLRISFTAPSSGKVMVRMICPVIGATTYASILLGILNGSTVMGRQSPWGGIVSHTATSLAAATQKAVFMVDGLTPGNFYTWDAAYGVEILNAASSALKYGGPNDTTAANAFGAFGFEVHALL